MAKKNARVWVMSVTKAKYMSGLKRAAAWHLEGKGKPYSITRGGLKKRIYSARDLFHMKVPTPLKENETKVFKYQADLMGKKHDVRRWSDGVCERTGTEAKFEMVGFEIKLTGYNDSLFHGFGSVSGARKFLVEWWMAKHL